MSDSIIITIEILYADKRAHFCHCYTSVSMSYLFIGNKRVLLSGIPHIYTNTIRKKKYILANIPFSSYTNFKNSNQKKVSLLKTTWKPRTSEKSHFSNLRQGLVWDLGMENLRRRKLLLTACSVIDAYWRKSGFQSTDRWYTEIKIRTQWKHWENVKHWYILHWPMVPPLLITST